ncbi:MAG: hypothetical protein WB493_00955 [Anaeromyxobacteraceae bacterium]
MLAHAAAALLALSLGQAVGSRGRPDLPPVVPQGTQSPVTPGTPVEAPPPAPAVGPSAGTNNDLAGPAGVPFMPTVGRPAEDLRGVFLDAALLTQVRTRSLNESGGSTTWGTDLEVTPGLALEVNTADLSLSVGYAPRFTVPFESGGLQLAILSRATLRADWRVDPLWLVQALGVFVFGDYSQLVPASTPGGAGPVPPVINPVRSFQTYPYVGIDTLLRVEGTLSPRARLRLQGGYFDVGGTGAVGQANQPRAWGPQGEAAFSWDLSPRASLVTTVGAQDWIMSNQVFVVIATATESWRQVWTPELETTFGVGAGYSNREVESATAAGKVVPVAKGSLVYQTTSRQPLRLGVDVALAPYFDTYVQMPYQRVTLTALLDWRPSDAWGVGASFAGALAPYTVRAPESYATTGVSASYAPLPFLILTLGGFLQSQFQGTDFSVVNFQQWTGYVSIALRDRFQF